MPPSTNSFLARSDEIIIEQGGAEKFNAAKKKTLMVPPAQITLTGYTISFPTFSLSVSGFNPYTYFYRTNVDDGSHNPSLELEVCETEGNIPPQEWGPSALGISNALADIDLGPAPAGTDYVDVLCNIRRTTRPLIPNASTPFAAGQELYDSYGWPLDFIAGEWMDLSDAALVVEKLLGMSRMFWFEVTGGRILLRRKMTIGSGGFTTHTLDVRQNQPPIGNLSAAHVNSTGCSGANNADYSTAYTGDFVLLPCCKA